MLRTIHFHGTLEHPPIQIEAVNIYEAIEGASRQVACLQPNLEGRKVIQITGCDDEVDLFRDLDEQVDIHVFPVLSGEKGKFTQIIVGTALIALSMAVPGLQTVGVSLLGAGGLGAYMTQMGIMLVLGGVAQMLAPAPENMDDANMRSNYLGAPRNTVAIGTRIPILYGEFRCGGHYLSFDVNSSKSNSST